MTTGTQARQAPSSANGAGPSGAGPSPLLTRDELITLCTQTAVTGNDTTDHLAAFNIASLCGHLSAGDWSIVRNMLNSRFGAPKVELNQIYRDAKHAYNSQQKPRSATIINTLNTAGYDLTLNVLDDSVCVNGKRINDIIRADMLNAVQDVIDVPIPRIENAIVAHAAQRPFNPIVDFFNGLPQWDQVDRVTEFIGYLYLGDDNPLDKRMQTAIFHKWLLGIIGKAINREQNFVLIMDGPQNIGKSTVPKWLNPIGLHVEGGFDPNSKDHAFRMCTSLTWELPELQSVTRKRDREDLKRGITQEMVKERQPYGRHDIEKPIIVSFFGTVNNTGAGFLNDPTGSRRYAIVETSSIDWEMYNQIDKTQLWAQLWHEYQNGQKGYLSDGECAYRDAYNRQYENSTPVAELFDTHFTTSKGGQEVLDLKARNVQVEWSASEIITHLNELGLTGIFAKNKTELEEHLRRMGIARTRDYTRKGKKVERTAPYIYQYLWSNTFTP